MPTLTTDELMALIKQEIQTIEDAQDRMLDSVADSRDVELEGLYGEVDRAVRRLKNRAEVLIQLANPQRLQM